MTTQTTEGFAPHPDAVQSSAPQQGDYFGFSATEKFMFPDGVSYIEFRAMNEGEKKAYQDKTSQDMILERQSGNARMSVKQGTERHELLKACCIGWNLTRNGEALESDLKSSRGRVAFGDFLTLANPKLVEDLEKAIRKANPWLLQEMKSEDIQREIDSLQEMLDVAKKREEGEAS